MDLTAMNGYEFEDYISNLLKNMGFEIEQTTYSNDGGIDIIAVYNRAVFSGKFIIECKNWQGNVGVPEIRDLYGAVMDQRANKGIVITPSDFTEQAYEFAKGKNIELINGKILSNLIREFDNNTEKNLSTEFPDGFNKIRFDYLKNEIFNNSRIPASYEEMEKFLLDYILNDNQTEISQKIIDELIKNKEELIKRCYNTKSKLPYKNIESINKAIYCLVGGYIGEALEISLGLDGLRKYSMGSSFNENLCHLLSQKSACSIEFGNDCLTRNLYIIFKQLKYSNGLYVIKRKPNSKFSSNYAYRSGHFDRYPVSRYMDWDESCNLYIPSFYIIKSGKCFERRNSVTQERCIDIKKLPYLKKKNDELFAKLDLIMIQHGIDI